MCVRVTDVDYPQTKTSEIEDSIVTREFYPIVFSQLCNCWKMIIGVLHLREQLHFIGNKRRSEYVNR